MFSIFKTFMAVYETRSFSLAAKRLFVSQPTISHHIADLERELDCTLFLRNKRSATTPTPAADLLYAFSGQLIASWGKTSTAIQRVGDAEILSLTIGMSQSIAAVLFPRIAVALHRVYPHLHYDIQVSNSATVIKQLEGHKIDLGFIEQPLTLSGTQRFTLCRDQLVVAGTNTGTWITREHGSGMGYYIDQYLREQNITPRDTMTVNTNEMVLQLIKDGIGQALISDQIVPPNVPTQPTNAHFLRHFYLLQDEQTDWPHKKQITELICKTADTNN